MGLIIVDEEHDQSYKQDEGVIYNARDMAISRASFEKIHINLITSVPSIETYENIKKKKYNISKLISDLEIMGKEYLTKEFIEKYINENILGVNKELEL